MKNFPPQVPCKGACAYEDECSPTLSDPYGCGTCCACVQACHMEYDIERAYIPETPEQFRFRLVIELAQERGEKIVKWS